MRRLKVVMHAQQRRPAPTHTFMQNGMRNHKHQPATCVCQAASLPETETAQMSHHLPPFGATVPRRELPKLSIYDHSGCKKPCATTAQKPVVSLIFTSVCVRMRSVCQRWQHPLQHFDQPRSVSYVWSAVELLCLSSHEQTAYPVPLSGGRDQCTASGQPSKTTNASRICTTCC